MQTVELFLIDNNIEYSKGTTYNGFYYKDRKIKGGIPTISFKWKEKALSKLDEKLIKSGIKTNVVNKNKYSRLYNLEGENLYILIVYAVDSHVQLPKSLLKHFRTGDELYYMMTDGNKIIKSSARNYNTCFGYYSVQFEEYLNNNYESIISSLINDCLPFVKGTDANIVLKDLKCKVNKLFFMAFIRNPKLVEKTNKYSIVSKIFNISFNSEELALSGKDLDSNIIDGYTPVLLLNKTEKNLVAIKSLFSNMTIDGGIQCMIIIMHPKFGIALVPDEYYQTMISTQGEKTYLLINDEESLIKLNKQIYYSAKYNSDEIIGLKADLMDLKDALNNIKV